MKNEFDYPCTQYADDANFYEHCKISEIPQSITMLTNAAKSIFNPKKTIFMLFSMKQMSTKHNLNEISNKVMINNNSTFR